MILESKKLSIFGQLHFYQETKGIEYRAKKVCIQCSRCPFFQSNNHQSTSTQENGTIESKCTRYRVGTNVCLPQRFCTLAWAEISELDFSISRNEYVLRFYITMKNPFFMNIGSGLEYIVSHWPNFIQIKKCLLIFVEFIQVAIHEFEDKSHFF